jgi:hypothetical protein
LYEILMAERLFYDLPFTIYHLPFTIYHLPFTIYHLPFTIYHLPLNLQLRAIQRLSFDFALTFFVLRFTYIGGQVLI